MIDSWLMYLVFLIEVCMQAQKTCSLLRGSAVNGHLEGAIEELLR